MKKTRKIIITKSPTDETIINGLPNGLPNGSGLFLKVIPPITRSTTNIIIPIIIMIRTTINDNPIIGESIPQYQKENCSSF
jgi:hypothetical protein